MEEITCQRVLLHVYLLNEFYYACSKPAALAYRFPAEPDFCFQFFNGLQPAESITGSDYPAEGRLSFPQSVDRTAVSVCPTNRILHTNKDTDPSLKQSFVSF